MYSGWTTWTGSGEILNRGASGVKQVENAIFRAGMSGGGEVYMVVPIPQGWELTESGSIEPAKNLPKQEK